MMPNAIDGSFSLCSAAIDLDGVTFAQKQRRVEAVARECRSDMK